MDKDGRVINKTLYFAYTDPKYQYFERWEQLAFHALADGYHSSGAKRFMSYDQFAEMIFTCTEEESIKYIVQNHISLP